MLKKLLRTLFIKDRNFYIMVFQIAVPIAVQSLITTGVNMMDNLMISSLGETELSAVSLANQFVSLFQGSGMGI